VNKERIENCKSKLKKLRLLHGLTQQDLSTLSGINIKSIAVYEQEPERLNNASVSTVLLLSECLGCEMEDLIDRDYIMKK
jgi:transcriptional regulator with XRE-family HTH domain